jgi:hypothetical protein
MKIETCILTIAIAAIAPFISSCANPADSAVNAATANTGPATSAAIRQTTGHGTGPIEKTKDNTLDKVR